MRRRTAAAAALSWLIASTALVAQAWPAAAAPAPGQVFVVGDSITVAANEAIPAALPGRPTVVDARECRATVRDATYPETGGACHGAVTSGLHIIQQRRSEIGDTLVLQLGANDAGSEAAFRSAVDEVLRATADIPQVIWLTIAETRTSFAAANQVLRDATASHPNLRLADWAAISTTPGYTGGDGLHLRPAGAAALGRLIATTVGSAPGGAPLRCTDAPNPYPAAPSAAAGRGYWLLDASGKVWGFDAPWLGDLTGVAGAAAAVAMAPTPTGEGYWIVDRLATVHAFGDAAAFGDLGRVRLNAPVIAMARGREPSGYWLVAADGGVFSFGSASFLGSLGSRRLNSPVISATATSSGQGYFLVAGDGGVFTFGDSRFLGSLGDRRLNSPVISMAVDPAGRGYWLYARDGGVFTFGDVAFHGSVPGLALCHPPSATVAMRPTTTGNGYWVAGSGGEVYAFGDAAHHGDRPALGTGVTIIDMAVRR